MVMGSAFFLLLFLAFFLGGDSGSERSRLLLAVLLRSGMAVVGWLVLVVLVFAFLAVDLPVIELLRFFGGMVVADEIGTGKRLLRCGVADDAQDGRNFCLLERSNELLQAGSEQG